MTSRTFTETGSGNTYHDWHQFAEEKAQQHGYSWLVELPPGTYRVVASNTKADTPPAWRDSFTGWQPAPLVGFSNEDRIAILEQQVAELQAQLEMRI